MSFSPATIRANLETNIKTVSGFRAYDRLPDSPEVPCAVVYPMDPFIQRSTMQKGFMELHYAVTILASRADAEKGQSKLDSLLATSGSNSVWAAIESDKTLSGACDDCTVMEVTKYTGNWVVGTIPYFGCQLGVRVLARG